MVQGMHSIQTLTWPKGDQEWLLNSAWGCCFSQLFRWLFLQCSFGGFSLQTSSSAVAGYVEQVGCRQIPGQEMSKPQFFVALCLESILTKILRSCLPGSTAGGCRQTNWCFPCRWLGSIASDVARQLPCFSSAGCMT